MGLPALILFLQMLRFPPRYVVLTLYCPPCCFSDINHICLLVLHQFRSDSLPKGSFVSNPRKLYDRVSSNSRTHVLICLFFSLLTNFFRCFCLYCPILLYLIRGFHALAPSGPPPQKPSFRKNILLQERTFQHTIFTEHLLHGISLYLISEISIKM